MTFSFCLEGFQFTWDFLMAVVFIVQKLSEEWPGLHVCVKTPCRTAGCPAELVWPDMDGKNAVYVCAVLPGMGLEPDGCCGSAREADRLLKDVSNSLQCCRALCCPSEPVPHGW